MAEAAQESLRRRISEQLGPGLFTEEQAGAELAMPPGMIGEFGPPSWIVHYDGERFPLWSESDLDALIGGL